MNYFHTFLINGQPILVPDADVELSYQDLDAGSAGRDESGVLHRVRVRTRVKTWGFSYFALSREAFHYMEALLASYPVFTFTYPDTDGSVKTCPTTAPGWDFTATTNSTSLSVRRQPCSDIY